jgi:hypothetical protein
VEPVVLVEVKPDAAGRRRFARATLVLTLVIVAGLTIGPTALAVLL